MLIGAVCYLGRVISSEKEQGLCMGGKSQFLNLCMTLGSYLTPTSVHFFISKNGDNNSIFLKCFWDK